MFAVKPIDPEKWKEIVEYTSTYGAYSASKKYSSEVNLSPKYLYKKLSKLREKGSQDMGEETVSEKVGGENGRGRFGRATPEEILANAKAKAQSRKYAYEGIQLTWKEKKLIKDIADGKVDLETASRVIASKAFEKLLKFPDSASFTSFIQSELLKLKRQEITDKNTWAMELINRMFAGELPPRVCPDCGRILVKLPELVTENVEDVEPIPLTAKNSK